MNIKHGICVYHLTDMIPCTGKKCERCEHSPAFAMGYQKAKDEIWPTMKEINDLVYEEGFNKGFNMAIESMATGDKNNICTE